MFLYLTIVDSRLKDLQDLIKKSWENNVADVEVRISGFQVRIEIFPHEIASYFQ